MSLLRASTVELRRPQSAGSSTTGHWSYGLTVFAALIVVAVAGVMKAQFLPDISNLIFDWYQRVDPRAWNAEIPVRIIDIDDESLARIGQWPWPRPTVAEIVTRLTGLDAAVVAIDIVFAEPDGSSPEQVIALLPPSAGRNLLENEIKGRPSNDATLAEALAQTRVVLGVILTQDRHPVDYTSNVGVAA